MPKNLEGRVEPRQKLLVAINSYGDSHGGYLAQLIREYRSMPFETDIVVLSNAPKELGADIEVVVGLPSKNPWSLPFGHKRIFADRMEKYDLFIYSEDDILITERNIQAFLRASEMLNDDEVAGFFRKEVDADGVLHYPEAHAAFQWDPLSVCVRGEDVFAFFTNEHAACYILNRTQLKKAISSDGFLVPPHEGKYDMLCAAATDPYTQCGFKKLVSVSNFDEFLVHHIPNKYANEYGIADPEMRRQLDMLLTISRTGERPTPLFCAKTRLWHSGFSKDHYEKSGGDIDAVIPAGVRNVLSVGYGRGAVETRLAARGVRVVAIPIDPVISAGAEARGIELVHGGLSEALKQLKGERFDCLLLLEVLHLVEDPVQVLRRCNPVLADRATVVATMPNLSSLPIVVRRLQGHARLKGIGDFQRSGVHVTSRRTVRKWFESAGLGIERITSVLKPRFRYVSRWTLGAADPLLATELILVAKKF